MQNDSEWIDYRLGDIIKGFFLEIGNIMYLDQIEKDLPNSIGGLYINRTKDLDVRERKNNYPVLLKIIEDKKEGLELPSENEIIFHIRLGDIVDDFKFGDVIFDREDWGLTLKEINTVLNKLGEEEERNTIILVYGSHVENINKTANNKYLAAIKELLHRRGFKVEVKNSSNPDKDFIYMSQSKKFIKSGGGFSKIIAKIVNLNGGVAYEK